MKSPKAGSSRRLRTASRGKSSLIVIKSIRSKATPEKPHSNEDHLAENEFPGADRYVRPLGNVIALETDTGTPKVRRIPTRTQDSRQLPRSRLLARQLPDGIIHSNRVPTYIRTTTLILPRYAVDNIFVSAKFKKRFLNFTGTAFREGLAAIRDERSVASRSNGCWFYAAWIYLRSSNSLIG